MVQLVGTAVWSSNTQRVLVPFGTTQPAQRGRSAAHAAQHLPRLVVLVKVPPPSSGDFATAVTLIVMVLYPAAAG